MCYTDIRLEGRNRAKSKQRQAVPFRNSDSLPPECNLGEVKVKLSMCLTKHHAMNTYWGSGGIAPRIL
jgi:hypothetical protein